MRAITKFLAGGVAIAALASAAPAAAQYYPGYGDPYGGNIVGQVLNGVIGGGYGGYGGYGMNSQQVVNICASAIQARLGGGYGGHAYASPYAYGGGRVLGISRIERRSSGGLRVRGVATSGRSAGYGYNETPDLTWKCSVDYRGVIVDLDVDRAYGSYGYGNSYTPYNNYDYSQYGYRRY